MKLSKVVFTHPTAVFGGDTTNVLQVAPGPDVPRTGSFVDSIEVTPLGLLITRGDAVAWVPGEAAESGIVDRDVKPGKKS